MSDDEVIEYVKANVGREHGLSTAQARRLIGSTLGDLHEDARHMAKDLGLRDPTTCDDGGRYAVDMNQVIRQASGRQ